MKIATALHPGRGTSPGPRPGPAAGRGPGPGPGNPPGGGGGRKPGGGTPGGGAPGGGAPGGGAPGGGAPGGGAPGGGPPGGGAPVPPISVDFIQYRSTPLLNIPISSELRENQSLTFSSRRTPPPTSPPPSSPPPDLSRTQHVDVVHRDQSCESKNEADDNPDDGSCREAGTLDGDALGGRDGV